MFNRGAFNRLPFNRISVIVVIVEGSSIFSGVGTIVSSGEFIVVCIPVEVPESSMPIEGITAGRIAIERLVGSRLSTKQISISRLNTKRVPVSSVPIEKMTDSRMPLCRRLNDD